MFFFFVCGEHTFRKELPGYEGVICQCHHCGNMSGHVLHRRPFFTFCFVPLIPFTISGYKDIVCHICNHAQPLEARPDVQAMANGGAGPGARRTRARLPTSSTSRALRSPTTSTSSSLRRLGRRSTAEPRLACRLLFIIYNLSHFEEKVVAF
uniref:Zinc-ribbon 15 domain-containing protein n=1 Tax=Bionectria ochroleuca TaxID=29856 RepID=A0A8H7N7C5_BIOOC